MKIAGRTVSSLCKPQQDGQHWPWKIQVIAYISSEPEGSSVFLQLENSDSTVSLYFAFVFLNIFKVPSFELIKLLYLSHLNLNYFIFKNMLTTLKVLFFFHLFILVGG